MLDYLKAFGSALAELKEPTPDPYGRAIVIIMLSMLALGIILAIAYYVWHIIIMWKLFTKIGKPGWIALIPIYNYWEMLEIVEIPGWVSFGIVFILNPYMKYIAIAGLLVLNIFMGLKLPALFGREGDGGLTLGLIFLPPIYYGKLAFGKDKYIGKPTVIAEPIVEKKSNIEEN